MGATEFESLFNVCRCVRKEWTREEVNLQDLHGVLLAERDWVDILLKSSGCTVETGNVTIPEIAATRERTWRIAL